MASPPSHGRTCGPGRIGGRRGGLHPLHPGRRDPRTPRGRGGLPQPPRNDVRTVPHRHHGRRQAALHYAFTALLEPGDEVLLPAPYWVSYPRLAALAGSTLVPVRPAPGSGLKVTADQLRAAVNGDRTIRTAADFAELLLAEAEVTGAKTVEAKPRLGARSSFEAVVLASKAGWAD
ncbi:aminotransferase class I/II-fold pyridoxal phosphate-dependent enzyme [Streptomyces sp. NPDC088097]|uniref:aminotransferase class I/II-fold pyridoxal phosphate-dependent enzyme n=1 Tax=Streptomyces sp. NPDC088097 TaxID=3365823 RepID=UPI003806057C